MSKETYICVKRDPHVRRTSTHTSLGCCKRSLRCVIWTRQRRHTCVKRGVYICQKRPTYLTKQYTQITWVLHTQFARRRCCSMLQSIPCVAVFVAVCCSVLQCVAPPDLLLTRCTGGAAWSRRFNRQIRICTKKTYILVDRCVFIQTKPTYMSKVSTVCKLKTDGRDRTRYPTGWRRLIGSPKLQIIFHKRATKYGSLLRKMTYKDKGSYESSPPCKWNAKRRSGDSRCPKWNAKRWSGDFSILLVLRINNFVVKIFSLSYFPKIWWCKFCVRFIPLRYFQKNLVVQIDCWF